MYSYKNSDIPSRWIFFHFGFPLMDWYPKKNTPTVTSHIPLFLGGYFSKMLGYLRHARWTRVVVARAGANVVRI